MVLYVDEVHTEMPVPTEMPSPSAVHGDFDEEARGSPRVLVCALWHVRSWEFGCLGFRASVLNGLAFKWCLRSIESCCNFQTEAVQG